ncbi:MAG: KH domain-containing protein [Coriobacteriia bacterium]|nr:KH domain-containing protein [Coriobacteriia bacterium]
MVSEEENSVPALVETIVTQLVDYPDQLELTTSEKESSLLIELHVAADDVGKVIGRHGRVIKAIRSLARAASAGQGHGHVDVEIVN